jgi:hypothetical protein
MVRSPPRGNSGSRPTSSMASSLVWGSSSSNVYELPGHRESGSPRSSGTTCSRTRSVRKSRWRFSSSTTSPPPARSSVGAHSRTSIRARTTPRSTTTTTPGHRCCSWRGGRITVPAEGAHSNTKHYKSKTVTEIVEFDGPHFLPAIPGWRDVADHALDCALQHAMSTKESTRLQDATESSAMAGLIDRMDSERRGNRRLSPGGATGDEGTFPPWLKVVVVLEELRETHAACSEDDRADPAALRAVGHRKGGAHGQQAIHHR